MHLATRHSQALIFRPGADVLATSLTADGLVLQCPMPWLAGPDAQVLAVGAEPIPTDDGWLLHDGETLAGVLVGKPEASLEVATLRLYQRLLALTGGLNRYRIWNFVPHINAVAAGEENYVAFNSGRHRAFADHFGGIHRQDVSAASAVGTTSGPPALAFIAGPATVEHFENPLQTPSADYPERYGRSAPLFARGSRVREAGGATCWHLAGTASIRSSDTVGGDFATQLETTLENIGRMLEVMAVPAEREAAWKVFLRDRRDLAFCRQRLGQLYPTEADRMMFVEADICRRDLLLEIEGIFHESQPPNPSPSLPDPPPP